MRYFIELSYDGTPFVGWQRQPAGDSVQSCLEDALSILFRKPLSIVGAGRTDAGVHAHQLFAHVDLDEHIDQDLTFRLNKLLPKEIAVRNIILLPKMLTHALMRLAGVIVTTLPHKKIPFCKNVPISLPSP